MLYVRTQQERKKAGLVIVLLGLCLFQSVVAAAELGTLDLHSPEIIDQLCTHNCIDHHYEFSDIDNSLPGEDGKAHCNHCGHCLGCHLTAMVHNLTTHPIFESRSRFTYLARLTKPRPTNIDRPPIA